MTEKVKNSKKKECIQILKDLTNKKNIYFTNKGNSAIKLAMKFVKEKGYKQIAIQDQAGWMTYPQFAEKLKFKIIRIKTEFGLIKNYQTDEVAIINSMPAYSFLQNMNNIKAKFLINDVSASIGTDVAKIGDIILGSFGRWKPINVKYGGFIATDLNFEEFYNNNFDIKLEDFYDVLYKKLLELDKRLFFLKEKREKIISNLKNYDLLYPKEEGLNLIVKYSNEEEKQKLINYCDKNKLEHTLCPRDIRVLCDAVSIEIKRL